jgi:hypothetical protein
MVWIMPVLQMLARLTDPFSVIKQTMVLLAFSWPQILMLVQLEQRADLMKVYACKWVLIVFHPLKL